MSIVPSPPWSLGLKAVSHAARQEPILFMSPFAPETMFSVDVYLLDNLGRNFKAAQIELKIWSSSWLRKGYLGYLVYYVIYPRIFMVPFILRKYNSSGIRRIKCALMVDNGSTKRCGYT